MHNSVLIQDIYHFFLHISVFLESFMCSPIKKTRVSFVFLSFFPSNFGTKLEIFDPQGRLGAVAELGDVGCQFTVLRTRNCENWRWHPLETINIQKTMENHQFRMGKSTIFRAMFNSYVSLLELVSHKKMVMMVDIGINALW